MGDLETTAELVVKELPPEIVRKMKDQLVYKGGKATFEVIGIRLEFLYLVFMPVKSRGISKAMFEIALTV